MNGAVLVTGAARNIGRVIADTLAAEGNEVVRLDKLPVDDGYAADLGTPESLAAALAEIARRHRVTRLVLNAAELTLAPLAQVTLAEMDRLVAVNARANLQIMQAFLPAMRQAGGGRVVTLGSRSVLGSVARETAIAASKAAMVSLTRVWALELAASGITVNMVAPGGIETDMLNQAYRPGTPERLAVQRSIPVGRFGQAAEIADAVRFFLDPRSGFITGQVLYLCGGITAGRAA